MKPRFSIFLGGLVLFAITQAAGAADATWTGLGADSLWTTSGNWSTSPVPGAGNTATFDSGGNGKTTITTAPAALTSYVFNAGSAAYTISSASTTWSVPNGGGVTINSGVTTDQNLSGIQYIRPASGTTTNFSNQAANTTLKLGTIFNSNTSAGNALLKFTPTSGATIEVISGKNVDNASTAGRTVSILLDDAGTLKMAATGTFSGTDADGNSVTIRQGTLMANTINIIGTARTSLGAAGRIQFGKAGTTNTATLDYYNAASTTTDRAFYIIDNNTAVFKVSGGAGTNLAITTAITQSAATNGGGKLTKDGAGTLTLSAANTYTGDTLISNGKIALGISTALQNSAYDTTGSTGAIGLDVTGYATPTLGGLKGSVNLATAITGYSGVTNLILNPQSGKSNTYTGNITDGAVGMTLTKSGTGTQVLSGDNSFTGNVTVSAGTLKLTHSNALGTGTKGFLMQGTGRVLELSNNITLGSNITMHVSSNSSDGLGISNVDGINEIQGQVNITTGNPALNISSAAGTLHISGNVTLTATARPLHLGGASANANTISGIIGETGGVLPVIKQGVGTWVLSNANTYTGVTTLTDGTLSVSSINNGGEAGNLGKATADATNIVFNGGTLKYTGSSATSDRSFTISATKTATIEISNSTASLELAGATGAATNGALTKTGGGKLVLSGSSTYTGATTVTEGKLVMGDATADTFATTSVSVASGATLGGSGTFAGTLSASGILAPGNSIGTLNAGTTTWNSNNGAESIWEFELGAGNTSDKLAITGDFLKGTGSTFKFDFMGSNHNGTFSLVTWTGTTDFDGIANDLLADDVFSYSNLGGGRTGSFSFSGNSLTFTAVPEPTSALAGLLLSAGLWRRRRG